MGKKYFAGIVSHPAKDIPYSGTQSQHKLGGLREVSSAWAMLKTAQKPCVNEHSPGVHKPKAWLPSELPWLKANLFHNISIFKYQLYVLICFY